VDELGQQRDFVDGTGLQKDDCYGVTADHPPPVVLKAPPNSVAEGCAGGHQQNGTERGGSYNLLERPDVI